MGTIRGAFLLAKEDFSMADATKATMDTTIDTITTASSVVDNSVVSTKTKKTKTIISNDSVCVPELYDCSIELNKFKNPSVNLRWKIKKKDIGFLSILGFNVYKKYKKSNYDFNESDLQFLFSRVSYGSPNRGKFSQDKKAIENINPQYVPFSISNNEESKIQEASKLKQPIFEGFEQSSHFRKSIATTFQNQTTNMRVDFLDTTFKDSFEKMCFIDYNTFLLKQQQKQVSIVNDFIEIDTTDDKVRYGFSYEYCVSVVLENSKEGYCSNVVSIDIINTNKIGSPKNVKTSQVNSNQLKITCTSDNFENISKVHVFKKSSLDIRFSYIGLAKNENNSFSFIDDTEILFGIDYTYRLFFENVFGIFSDPYEFKNIFNRDTGIPKSKNNVLLDPVYSCIQDQNSDFVKISIFPNDSKVSYYKIERKDVSIYERKYLPISKNDNNYGSELNPWTTNIFFVEKVSNSRSSQIGKTIELIDSTVVVGHIYKYRIIGYDLFGNSTLSSIKTIKVKEKMSIPVPINLRYERIRNKPARIIIRWENDSTSNKNISFSVHRRLENEKFYREFPQIKNNFLVDEVSCNDYVDYNFENLSLLKKQTEESPNSQESDIKRPIDQPPFIVKNNFYYYRVAAINNDTGEISNFCEEIRVPIFVNTSVPLNFTAFFDKNIYPRFCYLDWDIDRNNDIPDHWIIERKIESPISTFETIGKSYLNTYFYDTNLELNKTYIYRICSVSAFGVKSDYVLYEINTK